MKKILANFHFPVFSRKIGKNFRIYCMLLIVFLAAISVFSLPISIVIEYGLSKFIDFYIVFYPHIVLYPVMLFWTPCICMILAILSMPFTRKRIRIVKYSLFPIISISALVTFAEQRGNNMMALEFSNNTQTYYCIPELVSGVKDGFVKISDECKGLLDELELSGLIDREKVNYEIKDDSNYIGPKEAFAYYRVDLKDIKNKGVNDNLFSYDFWNNNGDSFSYSRKFYVASVFSQVFLVISVYLLVLLLDRSVRVYAGWPSNVAESQKFYHHIRRTSRKLSWNVVSSILIAVFVFILWIPFRTYYNFRVKSELFLDNGIIVTPINFGPVEVFIVVFAIVFAFTIFAEFFGPNNDILTFIITLGGAAGGLLYYTVSNPDIAKVLFGFDPPQMLILVLWPLFMILIMWYYYVRIMIIKRQK